MCQRAELLGVHLERIARLVRRIQAVHVAQQEGERTAHVAFKPRGMHLGVKGMHGRERGASAGPEQAVPGARHGASRRAPGAGPPRRDVAVAQHGRGVRGGRRATSAAAQREQQSGVALALVDPNDVIRKAGRPGETAPHRPERLALEELVQPHRVAGGRGREPEQQPRRQPGPPVGGARTRREQDEAFARRLAGEGEQQQRLGVSLLGQRQTDAQGRRDAATLGVSQQRVRPAAGREAALRQAGEHQGVETQAADLERREHRHSVPTGATPGHARAGEQVTQHARRLVEADLLVEHGQRMQAGGCVASLVTGLLLEHGRDGQPRRTRPTRPRTRAPADRRTPARARRLRSAVRARPPDGAGSRRPCQRPRLQRLHQQRRPSPRGPPAAAPSRAGGSRGGSSTARARPPRRPAGPRPATRPSPPPRRRRAAARRPAGR